MKSLSNCSIYLTGSSKWHRRLSEGNIDIIITPKYFNILYFFQFGKERSVSGSSYRYYNKFWRLGISDYRLKKYLESDGEWMVVTDLLEKKNKQILLQISSATDVRSWWIIYKHSSVQMILCHLISKIIKKIKHMAGM